MQDLVAERLRLGLFQLAVQTGHLRPGEQRAGDEASGTQARFWVKLPKGRFCRPQSFQLRIRSSTRACPRWRKLESRDVAVEPDGVRDEAGVAVALGEVEHRELGAGVWALPTADEPVPPPPRTTDP